MFYVFGEKLNYGGLIDWYLIKVMLFIGLVFLVFGVFGQVL